MDSTRSTRCVSVSAWLTTAFARVARIPYRSLQSELAPRACGESAMPIPYSERPVFEAPAGFTFWGSDSIPSTQWSLNISRASLNMRGEQVRYRQTNSHGGRPAP